MHFLDAIDAEVNGFQPRKQVGGFELGENGSDSDRRFDVSSLVDMMNQVLIVYDKSNRAADEFFFTEQGRFFQIFGGTKGYRFVVEGTDDAIDISGGASIPVFPLEDGPNDIPRGSFSQRPALAEIVENQIGGAGVLGIQGGLVFGMDDGPGPVSFVKFQPGRVFLQHARAQSFVVRQAFHENPDNAQRPAFVSQRLVYGPADSAAGQSRVGRNIIEVTEFQIRGMCEDGKPFDAAGMIFGDMDEITQTMAQRIV